ncbi:hypothetical protein GUITHDRAFT_134803 [Guillardia theta CCMP2712]|uniref:Uncharacterized protein n=1 Tax=Guillardia theta (strain CCMP2712) TaxID=905079 RepID=L1JT33_GUITC|nr:hypothetical protein GUITHDRAFT_134803 [Guillardia theta CCMP2712]EKX51330.1 hypothetical protein GUITHDRAFT_134803 [Guillardia theta CCMP2712]|eukprot:XP_005838310.1 hypothetical protein GUITHDRAFT_134803 [Guillardia theta CCMP2712]
MRELSSEKLSRAERLELWKKEKKSKIESNKGDSKARVLKDIPVNHARKIAPKDTPRPEAKTERKILPASSSNFKQHHQRLQVNRARNAQAPVTARTSTQKRVKPANDIKSSVEKLYSGIRDIQETKALKEQECEKKAKADPATNVAGQDASFQQAEPSDVAADTEYSLLESETAKSSMIDIREKQGSLQDSDVEGCGGDMVQQVDTVLDCAAREAEGEEGAQMEEVKAEEEVEEVKDEDDGEESVGDRCSLSPVELPADSEGTAEQVDQVAATGEDSLSSTQVMNAPSSSKQRASPIPENLEEEEEEEEENVSHDGGGDVDKLKFALYKVSNRLARCTSLLQEAVKENAELKHQLALNEGFKIRYEALESTVKEMKMVEEAKEAAAASMQEEAGGSEAEGDLSRKRVGGKLSPPQLSPKRARMEDGSPTTSSERIRLLTERILAQDKEIQQLRKAVKGKEGAFSQERKTLIERLRVVDEQRREAETALDENDLMWQQLFNNQMEQLKKKVQDQDAAKQQQDAVDGEGAANAGEDGETKSEESAAGL